jgi:hypothetical protein
LGLAFAVGILLMIPSLNFLRIEHDGILIVNIGSRIKIEWGEFESTSVDFISQKVRLKVNQTYLNNHKKGIWKRIASMSKSVDLPDTYGMRPSKLAALLESCRRIAIEHSNQDSSRT